MDVLSLTIIKQHLNIDSNFTDDDEYLTRLGNTAEGYTAEFLEVSDATDVEQVTEWTTLSAKPQVQQAMLMLVGTMYNNRESEVYSNTSEMKAFKRMLNQFKKWTV